MEFALSVTTTSASLLSVNRCSLPQTSIINQCFSTSSGFPGVSIQSSSLRAFCAALPPIRRRFLCFSSSASAAFASGGGDGGAGGDSDGGGGDGGPEGGDLDQHLVSELAEDISALVIVLHVGGMTCGGCAASVKRILESQPQVSSASVDLETETAIVRPVAEAKVAPNWQKQLGEELAKHLTNCGFASNFRGGELGKLISDLVTRGEEATEGEVSS